jgi:glycosyltransferase involved in cell wall biosynthesis
MNICFITYMYPGKHDTSSFAFVKQLVDSIAKEGHHCHVLAPFNISHYRRLSQTKEEYNCGKGKVTVYRPGYLSFSNWHIGKFYPSSWSHNIATKKAFRMLEVKPDVIYGHFWSAGYDGFEYAKANSIPLFVASGESEISKLFSPKPDLKEFSDYVRGVICVSSKNREESIQLGLTTVDKCEVFPNAVNAELFHKRDKLECRKQLGLSKDDFIVAFVGWFNERKGPLRVADAIRRVGETKSIFIGKGEQDPQCDGIVFKGALPHEQVPVYLGAADCFVLPTLHEGCCNAVVEAMACGLPIVSSNLPFNWDVLDETNSIMVNPNSIEEIASAIRTLRDDVNKRKLLAEDALKKAESLTITQRAKEILRFIEEKC